MNLNKRITKKVIIKNAYNFKFQLPFTISKLQILGFQSLFFHTWNPKKQSQLDSFTAIPNANYQIKKTPFFSSHTILMKVEALYLCFINPKQVASHSAILVLFTS